MALVVKFFVFVKYENIWCIGGIVSFCNFLCFIIKVGKGVVYFSCGLFYCFWLILRILYGIVGVNSGKVNIFFFVGIGEVY